MKAVVPWLFWILPLCMAGQKVEQSQILPTGMSITPLAPRGTQVQELNPDLPGKPTYTADHPIATALSPDGNTLLVLTSGYNRTVNSRAKPVAEFSSEYVFIYDVRRGTPVKQQVLRVPNTYMGIAWASDGKSIYVSGGMDDNVHVFQMNANTGNAAVWQEFLPPIFLGHRAGLGVGYGTVAEPENNPLAAGVAVSDDGRRLLVANDMNDSVSLIDVAGKTVVAELDLRPGKIDAAQKGVAGGEYPYGVIFKGNDKAYVSSLRDREIVVLDLSAAPRVTGRIKTRGQPGKMLLNRSGSVLFTVSDNSDSVVMLDTKTDRVIAEIKTAAPETMLARLAKLKGANPNGLALAPDEKTLFVTNGGTNSVAVIRIANDLDDSATVGLIPTGWYPTSVTVSRDGSALYVVNAKSVPGPNPEGCRNNLSPSSDRPCALAQQYVWQLEKGSLATIPMPQASELSALTLQVARNNHFSVESNRAEEEKTFDFLRTKIRHVIYIVKENRSYDQVLGDLKKGNGDRRLNLFPEKMAPNHHDLARRFVTLDNFYDSGEVSGVGWNWSTAARTTDYVERTIPMTYADRGVPYDVEGINRGVNVGGSTPQERTGQKEEDADLLPGHADVAAPDSPEDESGAGYLWDSALRAKLAVRNYGFFINLSEYGTRTDSVPLQRDPHGSGTRVAFATKAALAEVTDPYFRSFDMRFADYWRFKEWEREFDEYVKNDNLPSLELLRLPHDHFGSFGEAMDGVNTVETMMADNDYALGLVAEKVAHSKYAGSTVIFAIEDDAQNGPDHVDAHRSIAYVIGPYVKHRKVVSQHYTTVSVLRTIEELLGIKSLGLNDGLQEPMTAVFKTKQSDWTYKALVPDVLRSTQLPLPGNKAAQAAQPAHNAAYWAEKTRGFDFRTEDKLDSDAFNRVLWEGLKQGESYPERNGVSKAGEK